jgi:hypothetical protein
MCGLPHRDHDPVFRLQVAANFVVVVHVGVEGHDPARLRRLPRTHHPVSLVPNAFHQSVGQRHHPGRDPLNADLQQHVDRATQRVHAHQVERPTVVPPDVVEEVEVVMGEVRPLLHREYAHAARPQMTL